MGRLNSLWMFVRRHKYFVVLAAIILMVGILDENSYLNRFHHRMRLNQLRSEIQMYQDQYDYADRNLKELENNPRAVERLAREKYFMKRANEDVFVVPTEEEVDLARKDTTNTDIS